MQNAPGSLDERWSANRCKGKRGSLALVLRGLRLLFFTLIFLAVTVAVVYLFVPLVGDLSLMR